ncbi:MAG: PAS domain S-box protein [Thermoleophilia bacterium]|nr:PAS domain S-box protein [Thermoleophilia bacterium]
MLRRDTVETLRAVLRALPLATVGLDREGWVSLWTPAAERLFGWSEEEVVGRFVPSVPEDRLGELHDLLRRVARGEELHDLKVRWQRRDGSQLDVSLSAAPLRDLAGEVVGSISVLADLTARKRVESELGYQAFLLASVSDAVIASDREFTLTAWNRAAERLYGWPAHEVLGRPAEDVLQTEPEGAGADETRRRLAETGRWHGEVAQRTRDGGRVRIQSTARAVRDREGRLLGYVTVNRDVTRERAEAEALALLEEQLAQVQKMQAVGQLAAGVAHDFNNLLTAIQGYAELLHGSLDGGDSRRNEVDEIARAARRGAELTRRLLAFSRREHVEAGAVDVGDLLERFEPLLRGVLGEAIELHLDRGAPLPAVLAVSDELEQVVLNLATNARDAMPGGGRLAISVSERSEGTVAIDVVDTGSGMSEDVRSRAFEPFFTTKERGHGTGLGLATVWGIVERAGGTVELDSEPGAGTRVTVSLPALPDAPAGAPAAQAAAAGRNGGGTILLVEDEESVRALTERILAGGGYEVLAAADAGEALALAGARPGAIDLLLTDLVLPGVPGVELAARMVASQPGLRVLGVSGYAGDEIEPGSGAPRGFPVLAKPFTRAALLARVAEVLGGEAA